jgi:L-rhamnose-H+ transport protein
MGLIAITGSVVPLLLQHNVQMAASSSLEFMTGIGIMLAGLFVCARAGNLRTDRSILPKGADTANFSLGIFYCAAAGILSALVNFALIFGDPIAYRAMAGNIDHATANNAVWAIVFTANYIVNIGYCLFIAWRRNTLHELRSESQARYWLLALLMGLLWAGGIVIYGWGASVSGPLGAVIGFPIMLLTSILTGNVAGAICGEWRGQPISAKITMGCGLCCMVLAIVALGCANYKVQ